MDPPLLILDLDETLIHASYAPLVWTPDFTLADYSVYRRPHLDEFLDRVSREFRVAVWSSAGDDYVEAMVAAIAPAMELEFLWGSSRTTMRRDFDTDEWFGAKDLTKVRRRGYDIDRILIVDDDPRKVAKSYGNAIYVEPFEGDPADGELERLARYLSSIRDRPSFRRFEKRSWRVGL